jgi:predicted GIY-YIG superfamily endonuclease
MPRTPINYENTVFYKIVCKDLNLNYCYVGHTTDFIRRKTAHKTVLYK